MLGRDHLPPSLGFRSASNKASSSSRHHASPISYTALCTSAFAFRSPHAPVVLPCIHLCAGTVSLACPRARCRSSPKPSNDQRAGMQAVMAIWRDVQMDALPPLPPPEPQQRLPSSKSQRRRRHALVPFPQVHIICRRVGNDGTRWDSARV